MSIRMTIFLAQYDAQMEVLEPSKLNFHPYLHKILYLSSNLLGHLRKKEI